jgi:phospholipid transport system substrate-binding protein
LSFGNSPDEEMFMRGLRIIPYLALLIVAVAMPQRQAAAQADPRAFMTDVGDRVIKIINDKQSGDGPRKQQFRQLVENSFDVPRIARFVLGRYWRTATDAEKQQFQTAFSTYMISAYWSHFTSYNGESLNVTSAKDQGNGAVLVSTDILTSGGRPPVKVDWYLGKSDNGFKIEDASLEGVSQLVTYRDEFGSIIEQNGGKVSALIDKLNERAKGS